MENTIKSTTSICHIDDARPIGTFVKMTFSGYKTVEAMKKLMESLGILGFLQQK